MQMKGPKSQSLNSKFSSKLNVSEHYKASGSATNVAHNVKTGMKTSDQNQDRTRVKDRADRATVDQVLDPKTRLILFKFMSSGLAQEINGCISTGKEVCFVMFTS